MRQSGLEDVNKLINRTPIIIIERFHSMLYLILSKYKKRKVFNSTSCNHREFLHKHEINLQRVTLQFNITAYKNSLS